jgi:hypothetical protein
MGGLLAAQENRIPTGGFAPKGWLTENGPQPALLRSLGLTECEESEYASRTRWNVVSSDGTLLVGPYKTGGSKLTYEIATELKKPLFHLAYPNSPGAQPDPERIDEFLYWLRRYRIQTLNVAGNRQSQSPGIAEFTRIFLVEAFV